MRRLLVLLALPLVVMGSPAHADGEVSFTVNSTADLPDASPGDGKCATGDGHCTLRAAIDEVTKSGSAVSISVPAGTFTLLNGPLVMTTDVTISGTGPQTVLDAGAGERVVNLTQGSLTLTSLDLKGGTAQTGGGAAIEAEDAAVALHKVQIGGAHSDQGGGALEISGGSVLLDGVLVHDSDGRDGGGLSAVNADVSITGSTFLRDTATEHGGALFVSYPSALAISSSTFDSNSAIGQGGAGYLEGRSRTAKDFTIAGTFTSNSSRDEGGALFVRTTSDGLIDGKVLLSGSTFTGNSGSAGGALGVDDGVVSVQDSTFSTNVARDGGGGAIAAAGDLTVGGSTFTGNTATESGGAIHSLALASVTGSTFTTNSAGDSGGALALQGWAMPSTTSSTFHGNTATQASGVWRGGAGLTQSKNTMDADQAVVVDKPARSVEKVSLASSSHKKPLNRLVVGIAAGLLLLLVILLDVRFQLRRRSRRKAATA